MQVYEVSLFLKNLWKRSRESWEICRSQMYITAQTNSTKRLSPSDVLPLPWDKKKETNNTYISNEDVERLKKKAAEYGKSHGVSSTDIR